MKRPIEIIRRLDNIKSVQDVCGMISVLSNKDDFKKASVALAMMIGPTIPHYHRRITEFYYVLKGKGKLITGRNTHQVAEGALIIIFPHTCHYTIPREEMGVLAFAVPAWTEKDQFILKENDVVADYSEYKEKSELIYEILSRADMDFEPGMNRKEKEALDMERQMFVMRAGYNKMSIPKLRKLLGGE